MFPLIPSVKFLSSSASFIFNYIIWKLMVLYSAYPLSLYLGASPYTQRFFLQKLWLSLISCFSQKMCPINGSLPGIFLCNNHAVSKPICGALGSLVVTLGWQWNWHDIKLAISDMQPIFKNIFGSKGVLFLLINNAVSIFHFHFHGIPRIARNV